MRLNRSPVSFYERWQRGKVRHGVSLRSCIVAMSNPVRREQGIFVGRYVFDYCPLSKPSGPTSAGTEEQPEEVLARVRRGFGAALHHSLLQEATASCGSRTRSG
jgi:hypothetical protein